MASHMIRGRQLSRDTEHRLALRRNLVQSLFEHGEVRTTLPKAKEVKSLAEKMITEAKKGTVLARRRVIQAINDRRVVDENQDFITEKGEAKTVVQRLFKDVAPRFASRNGGYTRIIKTPDWRIGDAGSIVILQLLQETAEPATDKPAKGDKGAKGAKPKATARKSAGLRKKRTEKRKAFASSRLTAKKA